MANLPKHIEVKTWQEVRLALDASLARHGKYMGYFIEREGWYEILTVEPWFVCDMPNSSTLSNSSSELDRYFSGEDVKDFEDNYKSKLIASELGQQGE